MKNILLALILSFCLTNQSKGQDLCGPNDSLCEEQDCSDVASQMMKERFMDNYNLLNIEQFRSLGYNIDESTHSIECVESIINKAREQAMAMWDFYMFRMQTEFCPYKCERYPTRCPFYDEDIYFWIMYSVFQQNLYWDSFNLIEQTAKECFENCQT